VNRIRLVIWRVPGRQDPSRVGIRLLCSASFYTGQGLTEPQYAIVDTGAPTSLIPYDLWQACPFYAPQPAQLRGVVPKPECSLDVVEATVGCVLRDDQTTSDLLPIRAKLAPTNTVPLLLGFAGLLEQARVYFCVQDSEAWLEV